MHCAFYAKLIDFALSKTIERMNVEPIRTITNGRKATWVKRGLYNANSYIKRKELRTQGAGDHTAGACPGVFK